METKMNRKRFSEQLVLNTLFLTGMLIYLLAQMIVIGYIKDILFVILLGIATLFLNYRQRNLYQALIDKEGRRFFDNLYSEEEYQSQIKTIFLSTMDNVGAVIFSILFVVVMWGFESWKDYLIIRICFSFFLFTANIPTGYAIFRILKYFYFNIRWIEKVDYEKQFTHNYLEVYIRKICTKVLFTATVYCTISLSSILFTDIRINAIVVLYTIFACGLVLGVILLNSILLRRKKLASVVNKVEKINTKILSLIDAEIEAEERDEVRLAKMQELIEIKDYVNSQMKSEYDISKVASNAGLLFITIIPIILQWVLDKI